MAVTAAAPLREHEKPMSWARAIVIATGFFFITAILIGQIPSYVFTVSTLATLTSFEQGFLALGLLSLGMGLVALEISFLYDPKPIIPWPLFAVVGLGIGAVGRPFSSWLACTGAVPQFLPTAQDGYYITSFWFQPNSIDLISVGLVALITGLGMFFVAVLNPWVLSSRAMGPGRDLLVRVCLTAAIAHHRAIRLPPHLCPCGFPARPARPTKSLRQHSACYRPWFRFARAAHLASARDDAEPPAVHAGHLSQRRRRPHRACRDTSPACVVLRLPGRLWHSPNRHKPVLGAVLTGEAYPGELHVQPLHRLHYLRRGLRGVFTLLLAAYFSGPLDAIPSSSAAQSR